jgi:hypothetical protein
MGAPGPSRLGTWDSHTQPRISPRPRRLRRPHPPLPRNPPTAGPTPSSAAPSTTPPAKPSTKSPSFSASAIPAVPGSMRSLQRQSRTPSPLHSLNQDQSPLGRQAPPHQGRKDRAHRAPRPAFSLLIFGNQNRRAALRRAPRPARRSQSPRRAACWPTSARRKPAKRHSPSARSPRSTSSPAFSTQSSAT